MEHGGQTASEKGNGGREEAWKVGTLRREAMRTVRDGGGEKGRKIGKAGRGKRGRHGGTYRVIEDEELERRREEETR